MSAFNGRMLANNGSPAISFAGLFHRAWFRRVWILQEVAVARKARLYCGSFAVNWSAMVRLARFLEDEGLATSVGTTFATISTITLMNKINTSLSAQSGSLPSLLELLEKTQNHSSTDPRDSIFALVGIASTASTAGIVIDYRRSCSSVYTDFAIHSLCEPADFSFLSFTGPQTGSRVDAMPTWVADWSLNAHPAPRFAYVGVGFTASGNLKGEISVSQHAETVFVTGYVVDVAQRVGTQTITPVMSDPYVTATEMLRVEMASEVAAFAECDDMALVAQPTYPTGESYESIYWRLMICNRMTSGQLPPSTYVSVGQDARYILEHFDDYIQETWQNFDSTRIQNMANLLACSTTIGKWSSGRVFCATVKNYLGWVARDVLPGDCICVLKGAEVPFILRRKGENWSIHGDCYIHGITEGQAMARSDLLEQTFVIC